MSLEVRHVGPESAAVMLDVIAEAFGSRPRLDPPADADAETVETLRERLGDRGGLLAVLSGHPVGAVVLDGSAEDGRLFLRRFGVRPGHRGHGIARALVMAALDASRGYREVVVLAREELPETVDFWARQGFLELEHRSPNVEMVRPVPATHDVATAEAMRDLGERLAGVLRAGDLVLLTGDLGAGKTTLAQGLGRGLGVRGDVTSPTFVIARTHPSTTSRPALVHVDAYRLGGLAELDDLDLDTSLDEAVTVVEWGEGLAEGLTDSRLEVRILRTAGAPHGQATAAEGETEDDGDRLDPRRVEVLAVGPRWAGHDLSLTRDAAPALD